MPKQRQIVIVLLVVAAGFFAGMIRLFILRFDAGDIYPAYSSLRADPLGTKALYEGLNEMSGVFVRRNFAPLHKSRDPADTAYLYLGAGSGAMDFWSEQTVLSLEQRLHRGGRVVVALSPVNRKALPEAAAEDSDSEPAGHEVGGVESDAISLAKRWRFEVDYDFLPIAPGTDAILPAEARGSGGPFEGASVSWHSSLYFKNLDKAWRVLFTRDGYPVIIERGFGRGGIVLCADAYPFSNESLREERMSALLAWMIGPVRSVVFDESQHGVNEGAGIMLLAWKYRLQGLAASLLILASLFVWNSSVKFIPAHGANEDAAGSSWAAGRDVASGLVNLLRRSVPAGKLLSIGYDEWQSSVAREREDLKDKAARMEAVLQKNAGGSFKDPDPVETYRTLCRILAERR